MFRKRRSTQKPGEDFYTAFKQSFPEVGPGTTSTSQGQTSSITAHHGSASVSEAMVDPPAQQRSYDHVDDNNNTNATNNKDTGSTPKPFADHWRLTPSLMDPSSLAFASFANQPPGYYTPTPGGFNTFYHPAGDLHTPGMNMNTPLSMPHSLHGLSVPDASMSYQHFNPHLLHAQHTFHDMFQQQSQHQQHIQPQSQFAPPSHFVHQDSGYAALDDTSKNNTPQPQQQGLVPPPIQQHDSGVSMASHPSADKLRFHTTLNAPTAMIRNADETPVTYLNKGQAYTLSIFDTAMSTQPNKRYRTYVRISFEDEQQRARPGACWQLWREGRGSNEAHQRGGRLLAVEYVDPNQGGADEYRKSQIELEKASFDGFVVNWLPQPQRGNGAADCALSVRFNFLSTDFSHSKGVKGIPVRLCAKTEILNESAGSSSNEPEVCFAQVKLFRDHGAERKLANDVAHVKKSIEKLKQQIAQAEAGMGNVGKRKRSGSVAKHSMARTTKVNKHKRSWSADSDAEVLRMSAEEDMHLKLVSLQDMFSSTRSASVLYLKGDPEDDPDLYPVRISGGDDLKPITRTQTWESKVTSGDESPNSEVITPASSSQSTSPKRKYSEVQKSAIVEEEEDDEEERKTVIKERSVSQERPAKMIKRDSGSTDRDLLALDVDGDYKPPPERTSRPVACFYVRGKDTQEAYYRAVYVSARTVADLTKSIAEKFQIEPSRITRVTHINSRGLHIIVDEDVVREMPEGQDIVVEFAPAKVENLTRHEFVSTKDLFAEDDHLHPPDMTTDLLEMWLNY